MISFDLVEPMRQVASFEASEVMIPGAEGDFTVLGDHMPLISTLRPGLLQVRVGSDTHDYIVAGGFVEISGSGADSSASVLATFAMERGAVKRTDIEALVAEAEAACEACASAGGNDGKDAADKVLADTRALLDIV